MSGKVRHLLLRDGRYYARLTIPQDLRHYLDSKTELRTPLGADRRVALSRLSAEVAKIQQRIATARQAAAKATGKSVEPGRYPLADDQIALLNYQERLAFDDILRNDWRYASIGIDDLFVRGLREGIAGRLDDNDLNKLVGDRIHRYRALGNTTVVIGTVEWRALARILCQSEYEALSRAAERDEGDYTGKSANPILVNAKPIEDKKPPVSIRDLFGGYLKELKNNGKGDAVEKRWTPVIKDLIAFVKSDDANKITRKTIIDWKELKLEKLAPKTVKDVHLTCVKAVLNWAVSNDLLSQNPAQNIKIRVAPKELNRPKGFTSDEATAILVASQNYQPQLHMGNIRELPSTSSAKKWAPLLCAFTGGRITEITQLRKTDIREENGTHVVRITPEAGSVKARRYRDVPIHPQVVALGFIDFVSSSADGPLFYESRNGAVSKNAAQTVSGRVSQWLQSIGVIPSGVQPNHGWRHAFKTTGRELQIETRILDAIQGHASRTAGDDYGDVTVNAMKTAINKFPWYQLS